MDYASEYRYRDPIGGPESLGLLITQSGETADTLAAQREMKAMGSKTVAICNVVGAMVAREAHGSIYTHAGPEIGVASTKAFTSQLTALFLLAMKLGQLRGKLDMAESIALIGELGRIPAKIEEVLRGRSAQCEVLAKEFSTVSDFLYLGRGIHFPIALEGALKLKRHAGPTQPAIAPQDGERRAGGIRGDPRDPSAPDSESGMPCATRRRRQADKELPARVPEPAGRSSLDAQLPKRLRASW